MRVRGFPFSDEVREFLADHDVNFVVEQNRDAQLRSAADASRPACRATNLTPVLDYAGFPLSAHHVVVDRDREPCRRSAA